MQNKNYPELRECPFCGGEAEFWATYDWRCIVQCTNCYCRTLYYYDAKSPVKVWNRRAANDRIN